jgi:hypothetical protein
VRIYSNAVIETHFSAMFFATLHTSLVFMSVYCRYKYCCKENGASKHVDESQIFLIYVSLNIRHTDDVLNKFCAL